LTWDTVSAELEKTIPARVAPGVSSPLTGVASAVGPNRSPSSHADETTAHRPNKIARDQPRRRPELIASLMSRGPHAIA
jgi:hypothetical protein